MSTFTLYRFYTADDALLYVGLTINPGRRMEKHRDTQTWWPDVARIAMEQHPDLPTLREAERKAIQTEKPRHNIRMNGDPKPLSESGEMNAKTDGLVGRWFHSWRPVRDGDSEYLTRRGERVLELQGQVLERIEHELYLIQTYSWMDGNPYETTLVPVSDMAMWTFYSNHIEMIATLGCREWVDRGADRHECRSPAEYLTTNIGLGSSAVCDHCAGYYSSVQPIIWKNGIASLGPKTTVPHPLSVEGMSRR